MPTTQPFAIAMSLSATLLPWGALAHAGPVDGDSIALARGTASISSHQIPLYPTAAPAADISAIVATSVAFIGTLAVGHLLQRHVEE